MLDDMDILEAAPDLYCIRIPIPSPLAHVNCYLARGPHGWTVVDTGFHTAAAEAAWTGALGRLGIAWTDIERIVVTHYHPDHYGAAGWLQQQSGAPVLMHEPEAATARWVWSGSGAFDQALAAFARRHGAPEDAVAAVGAMRAEARRRTLPAPQVTTFQAGDPIAIGNRTFATLCTPGHTDGLVVLWHEGDGILLANDMVLTPISPNISAGPASAPNPLADYLASLERVAALPARLTLTGHRDPIHDLAARCAELAAHHRRRLEETLALAGGRRTAWEVAQGLFARQINSPATTLFALGETMAHLEFLRHQGRLESSPGAGGQLVYSPR